MTKALFAVFALSVVFAVLFAIGGAGIYGSPFANDPAGFDTGNRDREKFLMALTILVTPIACIAALLCHRVYPRIAGATLVLGVFSSGILGSLTRFRYVWEGVFLIFVWMPITLVAFRLFS